MSVLRQLSNRHVERLQLFMEKHYLNEWKLSDFSREFGMGLTTFGSCSAVSTGFRRAPGSASGESSMPISCCSTAT